MSGAAAPNAAYVRSSFTPAQAAPAALRRSILTVLFADAASAAFTIAALVLAAFAAPKFLSWIAVDGVWVGDGEACRAGGACFAFLREKFRLILFGIYPPGQHWRPLTVIVLFLALALWSLPPRHWTRSTAYAWIIAVFASLVLMRGGILGLPEVATASWGGLPITVLLTVFSLGAGFPLAVVLALGRQSELRAVHVISVAVIELVRGLPLLSLLFIASILLPLMLPEGMTIDKFARAICALTIFSAAYIAEVLRGGLQAIPSGQREAARALGLSWFQETRLIVLPQAIRKVIPPLTNTVIVMVKNTSLVLVVGLFDLLSAGRAALTDPAWPSPHVETYLFIAAIYFAICFSISRYSRWIELKMAQEGRNG